MADHERSLAVGRGDFEHDPAVLAVTEQADPVSRKPIQVKERVHLDDRICGEDVQSDGPPVALGPTNATLVE